MKSIALMAVAGLATVASAQSLSVNLSFDATSIAVGDSVTATVSATLEGFAAGSYLSSLNIDLIASGALGEASNVSAVAWNNPALGFNGQGTASGADVLGVQASQFSLIPPITAGDVAVISFTFTASAEGVLSYSSSTAAGAPFSYSVTGPSFADQPVSFDDSAFSSGSLNIVPAPSAMALLGLGGLVAGRRRR